jgi:hypothetical protein
MDEEASVPDPTQAQIAMKKACHGLTPKMATNLKLTLFMGDISKGHV